MRHKILNKLLLAVALGGSICASAKDINQDQWRKVIQLSGVPSVSGMDAPSVYVFFDPNCPATAKLFRANANGKSFADAPAVWIPVYYMATDSLGKAVSILREGKFSAIRTNFTLYDTQKKSGATAPIVADVGDKQKIDKAKQIWIGLTNTPATPMIVYKDKLGAGHVHLGYNPPEELERIISEAPNSHIREYQ